MCNKSSYTTVKKELMQIKDFNVLVDKMKDKMYRLALRVVRNEEDAHEVVQESFIKVWKKREKIAEVDNKEAYCMTIARNMAIDLLRAKKMSISDIDEHYDIETKTANPENALVAKDQYVDLLKIIDTLPESHKLVIHLRDIEGYTYKEIAELTDFSVEKVKVYLHRARTRLRQIIKNRPS